MKAHQSSKVQSNNSNSEKNFLANLFSQKHSAKSPQITQHAMLQPQLQLNLTPLNLSQPHYTPPSTPHMLVQQQYTPPSTPHMLVQQQYAPPPSTPHMRTQQAYVPHMSVQQPFIPSSSAAQPYNQPDFSNIYNTPVVSQPPIVQTTKQPVTEHHIVHHLSVDGKLDLNLPPNANIQYHRHDIVHKVDQNIYEMLTSVLQYLNKVAIKDQEKTGIPQKILAPLIENQTSDQKKQLVPRISSNVSVIPPDTEVVFNDIDAASDSALSPSTPFTPGTQFSPKSDRSFRYPTAVCSFVTTASKSKRLPGNIHLTQNKFPYQKTSATTF